MGCYDIVKIKSIKHKEFRPEHSSLEFQTKDLESNFNTFIVDKNILYFTNTVLEYTGDLDIISFYKNEFIEYSLSFYKGYLIDLRLIQTFQIGSIFLNNLISYAIIVQRLLFLASTQATGVRIPLIAPFVISEEIMFIIKILFALKTKVLNYYNRCVEEAMDKSWSTAREPNPNAF